MRITVLLLVYLGIISTTTNGGVQQHSQDKADNKFFAECYFIDASTGTALLRSFQ